MSDEMVARLAVRKRWATIAAFEMLIGVPGLIVIGMLFEGAAHRLVEMGPLIPVLLGFPAALAGTYLVIGHRENIALIRRGD